MNLSIENEKKMLINDFWVEIIAKQQVHVKLKYLIR